MKCLYLSGVIYFTGYGKFFDEEYTNECSTVSWSTWISVSQVAAMKLAFK
jgi:hypothetical protein